MKEKLARLEQLIGNTPLVQIDDDEIPNGITIFGKLEGNNPAGSVKDRPAFNMIKMALKRGEIDQGTKLVEATSGNTGIALAMVAANLGLDLTLLMPENSTIERVKTMRAYGAKVVLTEADRSIEYSRELALEMVEKEGYVMLNQFENDDNWQAHYKTTGPEIWRDTNGELTHFVATMGTTGTIMGNSTFLKEKNNAIQIVGVQPKEGESIPGIRKWSPEYVPSIFDASKVDYIEQVDRKTAISGANVLSSKHGIFAGMSSGGVFEATKQYIKAKRIQTGVFVFIVCDRGDRYLSSELYA